jgi:cytochrome c-type biogenesis protein CcmH
MLRKPAYFTGLVLMLTVILMLAVPAFAQDSVPGQQPATVQTTVTQDEVNAIAKKLYCPVCENIPLDTCGTAACEDWRYEIRLQLEQGLSEQEIVTDFVTRFGDRVVGTPQDPLLRAISLYTPWIAIGGAVLFAGAWMLSRSRRRHTAAPTPAAASVVPNGTKPNTNDHLRQLLEQDIAG